MPLLDGNRMETKDIVYKRGLFEKRRAKDVKKEESDESQDKRRHREK